MSFLRTWGHTFEIYASRRIVTPLPISMGEKEPTFSMQAVLLQVVMLSPIVKTKERPLTLFSSVQFSHSVVSNSLWPHGPQNARLPCPSPTPGVYPNSCPLSQRCHPTISSSVVPFSSCPQSFLASGSFPMSQLFASGGQSIGVSTSTLVLPMNT